MEQTAYSKLNLYLKVTKKREDGYHNLESLFWPLSEPADKITLEEADSFSLNSSNNTLPVNENNLAGGAALLYAKKSGIQPNFKIYIEKNIPIAAGMGGGSADAAAVLSLLNSKYDYFSLEELKNLALNLGADVPFFLTPKAGWVSGIGEIMRPFECAIPHLPLIIVAPKFPVSAKWAYTHLSPSRIGASNPQQIADLTQGVLSGDVEKIAQNCHNDLAFAIYDKFPLMGILQEFMVQNGALKAEITGSGPVIYGICSDEHTCQELKLKLCSNFAQSIEIFEGKN